MSPQNLGPFAALNPLAWQLEAIRLAYRPEAGARRRPDRPAPKGHLRGARPVALLATLFGLLALP